MSVRVIAGTAKGRRLRVPPGGAVRPTADRARETLFNVVMARVPGARFLDVFAGSGAVGIEALSRGAQTATFIEHEPQALEALRANLRACHFEAETSVMAGNWQAGLRRLGESGAAFDLVFFDPPYSWTDSHRCLEKVAKYGLLAEEGVAIIEHDAETPTQAASGWDVRRTIDVGDSSFSMFTPCTEEPATVRAEG